MRRGSREPWILPQMIHDIGHRTTIMESLVAGKDYIYLGYLEKQIYIYQQSIGIVHRKSTDIYLLRSLGP